MMAVKTWPLLFLASGLACLGANLCIGPAATGSGSGSDWSNLKAWSATPTRGDTWYLVGGTYGGKSVTVAPSGTSPIIITKATLNNYTNLTSTGWSSWMATQSVFTAQVTLGASWMTFDGVNPQNTNWDQSPADYGFIFTDGLCDDLVVGSTTGISSNFVVAYVSGVAFASDPSGGACPNDEKFFVSSQVGGTYETDNVSISNNLANGWQGMAVNACWNSPPMRNWVIEGNVVLNQPYYALAHSESISTGGGSAIGWVVRNNLFKYATGTCIVTVSLNYVGSSNYDVYGNVFDTCTNVGNGIIGQGSSGLGCTNIHVFNNTALNCDSALIGQSGGGDTWVASGATNNLLYNCSGVGSAIQIDYSAYYSCTGTAGETHTQVGAGNPFVSIPTSNYELATNTTLAGVNLGSPYNVDLAGNTRTTWTLGAFEFQSAPTPPSTTNGGFPFMFMRLEPNGFGGQQMHITWNNPDAFHWYMQESINKMKTWPWKVDVGTNTSTVISIVSQQRYCQLISQ